MRQKQNFCWRVAEQELCAILFIRTKIQRKLFDIRNLQKWGFRSVAKLEKDIFCKVLPSGIKKFSFKIVVQIWKIIKFDFKDLK